jgi:hypothetical protein
VRFKGSLFGTGIYEMSRRKLFVFDKNQQPWSLNNASDKKTSFQPVCRSRNGSSSPALADCGILFVVTPEKNAMAKATSKSATPRKKTVRKKPAGKKGAAKKGSHKKAAAKKTAPRKWSKKVNETSDAMDLKEGVFKGNDPKKIAQSVKRSASRSSRRKSSAFQSAMSMLTFYTNRGGKNLSAAKKEVLEQAKEELRKLFGKEEV